MDTPKIPATVSILTRNNGGTIGRALESVKDFAEIIVADGGSTDDTLDIARTYGARVIAQNTLFHDSDGRLKDWSGVRNECLEAASYPWHFFIDSDEYASQELIAEIRDIIQTEDPAAYWVPRTYVLNSVVVERSLGYPNQQMRFFHEDVVTKFRKPVHERIELEPDVEVSMLRSAIYVPVESNLAAARAKMNRYIDLELARQAPVTWATAFRMLKNALKVCARYLLRVPRMLLGRGVRLPLARDLLPAEYELRLAFRAFKRTRV